MSRPHPRAPGSSAARNRRRLRFTRDGAYFVGLTLAIGLAAINTGNNLLYLVLGMMLVLIIGSGVLSEQTLRALTISRQLPGRVFAGQPLLIGTSVRNDKRRLSSFSIEVEDLLAGRSLDKRCYFLKVLPGRTQQTSYRHIFEHRGRQRFSGYRLGTRYPFSLFRKSREIEGADELLVYPRLVPVAVPVVHGSTASDDDCARPGRGGDFHGLRELRDGDPSRDICWRKSAAAGRLLVREHEQPAGRLVTLLLENGVRGEVLSPADLDRREAAVSRAASLAVHYLRRGHAVALRSRTVVVAADSGERQIDRILSALALIDFVSADGTLATGCEPGERIVVDADSATTTALPVGRSQARKPLPDAKTLASSSTGHDA